MEGASKSVVLIAAACVLFSGVRSTSQAAAQCQLSAPLASLVDLPEASDIAASVFAGPGRLCENRVMQSEMSKMDKDSADKESDCSESHMSIEDSSGYESPPMFTL